MKLDFGNLFHLISVSLAALEIRAKMSKGLELFTGLPRCPHTHEHTHKNTPQQQSVDEAVCLDHLFISSLSHQTPDGFVPEFINNAENSIWTASPISHGTAIFFSAWQRENLIYIYNKKRKGSKSIQLIILGQFSNEKQSKNSVSLCWDKHF